MIFLTRKRELENNINNLDEYIKNNHIDSLRRFYIITFMIMVITIMLPMGLVIPFAFIGEFANSIYYIHRKNKYNKLYNSLVDKHAVYEKYQDIFFKRLDAFDCLIKKVKYDLKEDYEALEQMKKEIGISDEEIIEISPVVNDEDKKLVKTIK